MRMRKSSSVAGTFMPGYSLCHSGSSSSSGPGSSTAPESEWAPTAEAFSSTQMLTSGLSCFSRMAHARPAGPAPTMTTSYCMTSRSIPSVTRVPLPRRKCSGALFRLHADRAIQADGLAVEHRDLAHAARPGRRIPRVCRDGRERAPGRRGRPARPRACHPSSGCGRSPARSRRSGCQSAPARARSAASCRPPPPWWPRRPPGRSGPRRRRPRRCGSAGRARRRPPGALCCIRLAAALSHRNVPIRLMWMTLVKNSPAIGPFLPSTRPAPTTPAQLTSRFRPPMCRCAASIAALTSASAVTSQRRKRAPPPRALAAACPGPSCTSRITTLPPCALTWRATAWPKPDAPPVMTARAS